MNSTRQKKLFLLILTLAGMCPAIYCADNADNEEPAVNEEPADAVFESNIGLPLQGEEIDYADMPNLGYEHLLSIATVVPIGLVGCKVIASIVPFLSNQAGPWLPSIVMRDIPYIDMNLMEIKAILVLGVPFGFLLPHFYKKIQNKSCLAILEWRNLLNQASLQHNRAVSRDVPYEGMIVTDEHENRTLLTRHDNEVHDYPFDMCRQDRQVVIDLVSKILLGPENLRRIRSVNERLDALGPQLHFFQNIKGAHRK